MKGARAPAGFHVEVRVDLALANGQEFMTEWTSPMALLPAMHKAPRWAVRELQRDKVKGRSKIAMMRVRAAYARGEFERET